VILTSETREVALATTHEAAEGVEKGGLSAAVGGIAVCYTDVLYNISNHFLNGGETIFGKIGEYAATTTGLGMAALAVSSIALRLIEHVRSTPLNQHQLGHGPKDVS
jgi:hypothetical protein